MLKNNPNTIHFYVKQLRAIYNKADDEGYVHAVYNPFHKIRLKGSKSPKRAISKSEVGKIAALELEGSMRTRHWRGTCSCSVFIPAECRS
ncbi:hypothetical protein SFC43_13735 [Bacteroides sp. CR5/BHMF/2]|nr:hypothetical protein [Bacteroides sp. CR5/BHMF/2]